MSCPNATAPINIKITPYSNCELKCDFHFSYPNSSALWLTNNDEYLSIKTETGGDTPVTYNESKYQIIEIRLYSKSLHTYAGENASAELIIHHKSVQGGNDLMVCIPIMNDNNSAKGESSELFRMIVSELAKQANSKNRETVVNIGSFSLNKLVPMAPYYTYTASLLYAPCNGTFDYVVFSKHNGGFMTMNDRTYALFTEIIAKKHTYTIHRISDSNVFYNAKGPSALSSSDRKEEIFIDCQPTGADGESLVPVYKSLEPALVNNIGDFFNSKIVKMVLPAIMIFLVVKFAGSIFNSISNVGKQSGGMQSGGGGGIGKKRN
jgi:carbonic anhydrase